MITQDIISKYSTPFYLFDITELKKRIDMIRSHQRNVGLCYAMKASPLLAGYISPYVDRLEVCSPGEYEICIRDHISPDKIMVSGVNKTRESMERIISMGGSEGLFTIESPEHFNVLENAASANRESISTPLKCYIRLTSGNQFGVDRSTLLCLADKVEKSEFLELMGIHFFSGTQKNLKKIGRELTELSEYGSELKERYGRKLSLEYGPGLGIDYYKSKDDFSLIEDSEEFHSELYKTNESDIEELMKIVEETSIEESFSDITFEYGRYIAATCGQYYTGIADVKSSEGTNYVILEGGLHQLTYYGSMAGMKVPYIEYIQKEHKEPVECASQSSDESIEYVLAGSLCSVNDILVRKISAPKLDIKDTLCFNLTGAYCSTEGISLFLSRDLPAILIRDITGNIRLIRDHMETNELNGGFING